MSAYVLDASVAAAWFLADEPDTTAGAALDRLESGEAYVPQLWHLEIRNVLLVAERRGRVAPGEATQHLNALARLPIQTDTAPDLEGAYGLARVYELTIYDAIYLELAMRKHVALATLDSRLAAATVGERLEVIA